MPRRNSRFERSIVMKRSNAGPSSASPQHMDQSNAESPGSDWKSLYKIAGAAALIVAVFIPIQVIVFVAWPPPSTVIGWFTLFQTNRLVGLLHMDLLLIFY